MVAEVHWEGALGFTYSSEQGRRVRVAYTINGQLLRDIYGELARSAAGAGVFPAQHVCSRRHNALTLCMQERERGPPLVPRQEAPPPPLNRGRRGRRGRREGGT